MHLRRQLVEGHLRALGEQCALETWPAKSLPMGLCHPAEIHQTEDHRVPNFCNGIQYERSIEGEKEECLPLALEEAEVAEDHRPIRAEMRMRVLIILHRQHRKSPDLQSLVEML